MPINKFVNGELVIGEDDIRLTHNNGRLFSNFEKSAVFNKKPTDSLIDLFGNNDAVREVESIEVFRIHF